MTIREMRERYPKLFYPQVWFAEEAFVDTPLPEGAPTKLPEERHYIGIPPEMIIWDHTDAVSAVELVNLFVLFPNDPLWHSYFWTTDVDRLGQRIFVGSNGMGLEIHRHLHISHRWAVPGWR